jgi:bacterial/archaeal transporter family protein
MGFLGVSIPLFAAATALLAKVGVSGIDSNLATAIRTSVILVFTWGIALGLERHHGLSDVKIVGSSLVTAGAVILAFA